MCTVACYQHQHQYMAMPPAHALGASGPCMSSEWARWPSMAWQPVLATDEGQAGSAACKLTSSVSLAGLCSQGDMLCVLCCAMMPLPVRAEAAVAQPIAVCSIQHIQTAHATAQQDPQQQQGVAALKLQGVQQHGGLAHHLRVGSCRLAIPRAITQQVCTACHTPACILMSHPHLCTGTTQLMPRQA